MNAEIKCFGWETGGRINQLLSNLIEVIKDALISQRLTDNFLGEARALPALRRDTQLGANGIQGASSFGNRMFDLAVGDTFADTNEHNRNLIESK